MNRIFEMKSKYIEIFVEEKNQNRTISLYDIYYDSMFNLYFNFLHKNISDRIDIFLFQF